MIAKKFFKLRFTFLFGALLLFMVCCAGFSLFAPWSNTNNDRRVNEGLVTNIQAFSLRGPGPDKWMPIKKVNSLGDTLIVLPAVANATVRVKKADGNSLRDTKYLTGYTISRNVQLVLLVAVFALSLMLLINFFRGLRNNKIFSRPNIRMMRLIALLVLILWFVDAVNRHLNTQSILYLFEGTPLTPSFVYPADKFLLLIVSGAMFFLAEVMVVGQKVSEENEMTI